MPVNVTNNGSALWTPSDSIPASTNYAAIIVDGRQIVVISSVFTIDSAAAHSEDAVQTAAEFNSMTTRRSSATTTRVVTVQATDTTTFCPVTSTQSFITQTTEQPSTLFPSSIGEAEGSKPTDSALPADSTNAYGILAFSESISSPAIPISVSPSPTIISLTTITASSLKVETAIVHVSSHRSLCLGYYS